MQVAMRWHGLHTGVCIRTGVCALQCGSRGVLWSSAPGNPPQHKAAAHRLRKAWHLEVYLHMWSGMCFFSTLPPSKVRLDYKLPR